MAPITCSTIGILWVIFAICTLVKERSHLEKWLGILIHPFVVFLVVQFYLFRMKATFPDMAFTVDLLIAAGILICSITFWLVYRFLSERFIDRNFTSSRFFFSNRNDVLLDSPWAFHIIGMLCFLMPVLTLVYRAGRTNDWNLIFFAAYMINFTLADITPVWSVRVLGWMLMFFQMLFYTVLPVFFVWTYIRQSKFCSFPYQLYSFVLFCCWLFVAFGSGARQLVLTPIALTFVLIITQYSLKCKFSNRLCIFFPFLILIALVATSLMHSVRKEGYPAIQRIASDNVSSVFSTLFNGFNRAAGVTDKSRAEKRNKHIMEMSVKESIEELIKENTERQVTQEDVERQVTQEDVERQVTQEDVEKQVTQEDVEKQRKRTVDFFLKKFKPFNTPDLLAWSLCYYGKHHNFIGIQQALGSTVAMVLPKEFFSNGKPVPIYYQIPQDIGYSKNFNWPPGMFCEGYVTYGYIGAIVNCIFFGLLLGSLSKMLWTMRQQLQYRIDVMIVVILIYQCVLYAGLATWPQIFFRYGCLIVAFIIVLVAANFVNYIKNFFGKNI